MVCDQKAFIFIIPASYPSGSQGFASIELIKLFLFLIFLILVVTFPLTTSVSFDRTNGEIYSKHVLLVLLQTKWLALPHMFKFRKQNLPTAVFESLNLLMVVFVQGSMRKYGSMAIPSQVLSQVKELSQKKSHVSPARKARMVKASSRHGFL